MKYSPSRSKLLFFSLYQSQTHRYNDISTHCAVSVQLYFGTIRKRKDSDYTAMEIKETVAIVPVRIVLSPRQGRNFTLNFLS